MHSIKIKDKTKKKVERVCAKLLLENNNKVTQIEFLEKIVENAVNNPEILEELFNVKDVALQKNKIRKKVKIKNRKKAQPRFFKDEWN
ncbi:MAG: hypothetical protein ACTSWY_01275 [Promethearchaeota archaeon]